MQTTLPATAYPHLDLDEHGNPNIAGWRIRVADVVMALQGWAATPADILDGWPFLNLGQVHSALAYYYDHQDEVDRYIEDQERMADEMFEQYGYKALQAKLRAIKDSRAGQEH
jgi:uncharacterized protein (DUF433 family)